MGLINNMDISFEETVDVRGINCGEETYLNPECSRDPERTPMQWSADENAGFTGEKNIQLRCLKEIEYQDRIPSWPTEQTSAAPRICTFD